MYALIVTIKIKPEHSEQFIEALLDDARGSVEDEPGCLRFDVLRDETDANTLYLYEVYRDHAAFEAHTKAPHFIRWRDTVKEWFAAETVIHKALSVFPADDSWK